MNRLFFSLFYFFNVCVVLGQVKNKGIPFITHFKPNENVFSTIVGATQDHRGILYVATSNEIWEFDATWWRSIKIKSGVTITSIASDANGRIYVGGKSEFGFLKANQLGEWEYHSLSDELKITSFREVIQIIPFEDKMLFMTSTQVFLVRGNRLSQTIRSGNSFDKAFVVQNQLFIREWATGLLVLEKNRLKKIAQAEELAYNPVLALFGVEKDSLWVASRNKGIQLLNLSGKILTDISYLKELNQLLVNQEITSGIWLNKQQIALGTSQSGILIINTKGQIIQHLQQTNGLESNQIRQLFLDKFQNLWACTDKGIAQVEINSPFSVYNHFHGLEGSVLNSILFKDKLYVGTSQGIFFQTWHTHLQAIQPPDKFKLVKDSKGFTGIPFPFQNNLIYSHHNGVLIMEDSSAKVLMSNEPAIAFTRLRKNSNYLLVSKVKGGLILLEKKDNAWILRNEIAGIKMICNFLLEDTEGNLWFSDYKKGIYKLRLTPQMDSVQELKLYDQKYGLPLYSRSSITLLQERPIFMTSLGAYRYNAQKDRFEPDQPINRILFHKTYSQPIVEDKQGNIWFIQFGKVGFWLKNPQKNKWIDSTVFHRLSVNVLSHITPIDDENILFGTSKGLFHYTPQSKQPYKMPFQVLIRQVWMHNFSGKDSLLLGGANSFHEKEVTHTLTLPYAYNNLKINFSAIWYQDIEQTRYRFFLKGLDEKWGNWTTKTEKNYTNLREGHYTFFVKAINIYNKESEVMTFEVIVLPPWYRTWWAYVGYVLGSMLTLFFLVRANTLRLQRRNIYLQKQIARGVAEIQQKNQELEAKNIKIQQSYQDIKLLGEIGKSITANLQVSKIVDTVYESINKVMDASIFGIGIYHEKKQTIDFVGAKEKSITLPDFSFDMKDPNRLAVWCLKRKREVFINDITVEYTKYIELVQEAIVGKQPHSLLYVPLFAQEKVIGVISVQSFQKNAYSYYHLDILRNVAIHTAIALENAQAYQRLAELNQEKNHLISIVAHDLRNPLHHILGMANVIQLNAENLSEKQADYVQKILDTTVHINQMIGKILDMNVVESEKIHIQWNEVDLVKLLSKVKDNFQSEAIRKNININIQFPSPPYLIRSDEHYTFQIFENLLSNALKFSNPDNQVDILIYRQNGKIRTSIQDYGPGISSKDMEKLFGKFQKLSAKPTAGEHSTGLGLSIVKKYVEILQGKVWCESDEGKGAVFTVEFESFSEN